VAGVEQFLNFIYPIAFFAFGDVFTGENQIIDYRAGIRPAAEKIVILEKRVMPVAGMGHNQRLHGNGVLFHQISDTRVGVNDDFIRQPLLSVFVQPLGFNEFLPNDQCG
jgi:hypothetical protein